MHRILTAILITMLLFCGLLPVVSQAAEQPVPSWQTLPPTPTLPESHQAGYAPINNQRIWYAVFGHGRPIIILHGGLANANYWGLQIPELAKHYQVIVMDSRGHGRSTRNEQPYTYDLMADDVIGLMDFMNIPKTAIVGWSDGGIVGLNLAIRYPNRIAKVFAFAANTSPSGAIEGGEKNATVVTYLKSTPQEYAELSPTPENYSEFLNAIVHMWENQPNFTEKQLASISLPVWIVAGAHDEVIKQSHTRFIAKSIPKSTLLIQPNVSHYSFLQNPEEFTQNILKFME